MMRDVVDVDDVDDVIDAEDQQVDTSTSKSIFSWDLKCWKRDEEEFRVFLQLWLQLKFSPHIVQCCLSLTHLLLSLSPLFPSVPTSPISHFKCNYYFPHTHRGKRRQRTIQLRTTKPANLARLIPFRTCLQTSSCLKKRPILLSDLWEWPSSSDCQTCRASLPRPLRDSALWGIQLMKFSSSSEIFCESAKIDVAGVGVIVVGGFPPPHRSRSFGRRRIRKIYSELKAVKGTPRGKSPFCLFPRFWRWWASMASKFSTEAS